MLVSEWQINRIGLVDFWYYDDEEFTFSDGRMLLRGANGSGKSVTMQSFIPLLLDGNKSSERLDPFGTKARRLENYLLEENDGREERTGYLYMEFKRKESDVFLTIGIGMCAKKNKRMDSWHFVINDGRRIGKDFFLYKDMKNKFTLTKKELSNRLGEGGQVIDSPKDYMKMVNDRLFGYETVEEYKELVDLLIQLRTPKLSKDFKPTVLNEILSNSLQPLSDEDLRPMSEAIENMDELKSRLEQLKKSKTASMAILKVYEKYNKSLLLGKAREYVEDTKQLEELNKKHQDLASKHKELVSIMEEQSQLEADRVNEQRKLEEQKSELDQNDVSRLMKQQVVLKEKLAEKEKELGDKEKQMSKKEEACRETEEKKKDATQKREQEEKKLSSQLEEMAAIFQVLSFDEHSFMQEELTKQMEEVYSYETIEYQTKQLQEHVLAGCQVLEKEAKESEKYEEIQLDLAKIERSVENAERELRDLHQQEEQVKSEWMEKFYQWSKSNVELKLTEQIEQEIAMQIEGFSYGKDFAEIRDIIRQNKYDKEGQLQRSQIDGKHKLEEVIKLEEEKRAELTEWMEKKDPEPELLEEQKRNRQWLREHQIPFEPLYKVLDYTQGIEEEQKNRLEEALVRMGALNALVVPSNYQNQVLEYRQGMADVYLFSTGEYLENSLQDVLEVTMESSDIIFYQELTRLLQNIGWEGQGNVNISNQDFQLGCLYGTLSGDYQAKYIGSRAREEYRQARIKELKEELSRIELERGKAEQYVNALAQALENLNREFDQIPSEKDLKIAVEELRKCQDKLNSLVSEAERIKGKLDLQAAILKEIRLEATEVCRKVYIRRSLEDFRAAREEITDYQLELVRLKAAHEKLLSIIDSLKGLEALYEEQCYDLDEIRHDLNVLKRELRSLESQWESITEQLELKNADEVRRRLEYCVNRLQEIPGEIKAAVTACTECKKDIENNEARREELSASIEKKEKEVNLSRRAFEDELDLGYVQEINREEEVRLCAIRTVKVLESVSTENTINIMKQLQEVFYKYASEMTEYALSLKSLFSPGYYSAFGQEEKAAKYERLDVVGKYKSREIPFGILQVGIVDDLEVQERLVSDNDRKLFEEILAHTISKKIRAKIYKSEEWVANMNKLMSSMNTSSGLKLSLRWKKKKAESEGQLDTGALVDLLKKDAGILSEEETKSMSMHFQSKVEQARRRMEEDGNTMSFHGIMKEILDYRNWFEFQLYFQKTGENTKELTNNAFFTFSGGEKAMAMYVPLFSSVVAKYQGARMDAPRLVSLDEAFAGVDENNINDMFRLMVELKFQFIINSQILWGDCETVPNLAIYQLIRPENAKFVSVLPYHWNGKVRSLQVQAVD